GGSARGNGGPAAAVLSVQLLRRRAAVRRLLGTDDRADAAPSARRRPRALRLVRLGHVVSSRAPRYQRGSGIIVSRNRRSGAPDGHAARGGVGGARRAVGVLPIARGRSDERQRHHELLPLRALFQLAKSGETVAAGTSRNIPALAWGCLRIRAPHESGSIRHGAGAAPKGGQRLPGIEGGDKSLNWAAAIDITHPAPRGACESSPASPREARKVRLPCAEDPGSRRPLNTGRRSRRR